MTNNDDAYRTAIALKEAGLSVPCIVDARAQVTGDLPAQARALGIRVETGKGIAKVKGGKRVTGVALCMQAGEGAVLEEIACDVVAMSGGWSPVVHLWSHCGGKLTWDEAHGHFRPDAAAPADRARWRCGDGGMCVGAARMAEGPAGRSKPVWIMPQGAGHRSCKCKDVAGLSERCESVGRAAWRRGRAMKASNIPSAIPRLAWRRIRAS